MIRAVPFPRRALTIRWVADSRIEKWLSWIEDPIRNDVLSMYLRRDTYETVGRIVRDADLPPSYYWEYLQDTYGETMSVAIRRQAEVSVRVHSLGQLINEVGEYSAHLTRTVFAEKWGIDNEYEGLVANKTFNEHFAGGVGDHVDPAIPAADLAALTATAEKVKNYVDRHLAHSDRGGSKDIPTFDEVHAAVDQIGELFKKYALLLTAGGYVQLVPVIQDDWQAIFLKPWLPPRDRALRERQAREAD